MTFGTGQVMTNVGAAGWSKRGVGATPSQAEFKYCSMGVGATGAARTAAVGDTALSSEVETRTSGSNSTVTTTLTNDTYQCVGTINATATRSVDEAGLHDAATTGNMGLSATFTAQPMVNGDALQFTWKYKQVPG